MPTIQAADGCRLYYETEGPDGVPAVLFSNSLGTRLAMWDPQMPALRERFRVIRYDSRGHGRSDAPAGDYTIQQLADDAVALLDGLGIEQVHVCGLSKGGMVGQVLGARYGQRVMSLMLCATACHMPGADLWDGRIRTAREQGMGALADQVIERWFTPAFRASGDPTIERVRSMILETPPEGYAGCCAAVRDMDLREVIGTIKAPTLIVAGADDPATPPEKAQEIAHLVAHAEVEVLNRSAHLLNLEQPVAFNRLLVRFLDEHS